MATNGGGIPIPGKPPENNSPQSEEERLRRVMEADEAEKRRDRENAQAESRSRRNKFIGGGVLAAVLLGGAGYGLIQADPFGNDKQPTNGSAATGNAKNEVQSGTKPTAGQLPKPVENLNFWQSDGNTHYPDDLEKWQVKPHEKNDAADITAMVNKYESTQLANSSRRLPSEEAGFTSDPTKAKLPDGTLNPMYSTMTAQDYQRTVESYIERLANPIYGNWQQYQYAEGKASERLDLSRFSDMFSPEYLEKNKGKPYKDYIPIYADWSSDNYGLKNTLLDNGPRWIGKVNSMESNFTYDDNTQQYSSDVTVKIRYSAWAQDQTILHKDGVLKLKVVTDTNSKTNLHITDASLNVS